MSPRRAARCQWADAQGRGCCCCSATSRGTQRNTDQRSHPSLCSVPEATATAISWLSPAPCYPPRSFCRAPTYPSWPPLADACDAVAHDATRWRAGAAWRRATRASSRLRALLAGPHLWRRRAGKRGRRASGSPRLRGRSSSWRQPGPASQRQRPLGGQRAPASCPDDLQTGAEHSLASTPVRLLVARSPPSVTGVVCLLWVFPHTQKPFSSHELLFARTPAVYPGRGTPKVGRGHRHA